MPLIVIKRKEKGLAKQCYDCPYFVELKDDPKRYPNTVAVTCKAPQSEYMKCFEYMWLMVRGRLKKRIRKVKPKRKPVIPVERPEINDILKRLKKIGVKKPVRL